MGNAPLLSTAEKRQWLQKPGVAANALTLINNTSILSATI